LSSFKTLKIFGQKQKRLTFLLFFLVMAQVFAQNGPSKRIIIIDPGHGGIDCGTKSEIGILEKNIVLSIAKKILRLNKTVLEDHFDIYLTRYEDRYASLSQRARLTLELNADLFISLHCNASQDLAQGMEVFVSNNVKIDAYKNILLSRTLAKNMLATCSQEIGLKNRGLKAADFQVLQQTIEYCPGILIEFGFLSDRFEGNYLSKESSTNAMALAILLVVNNHFTVPL